MTVFSLAALPIPGTNIFMHQSETLTDAERRIASAAWTENVNRYNETREGLRICDSSKNAERQQQISKEWRASGETNYQAFREQWYIDNTGDGDLVEGLDLLVLYGKEGTEWVGGIVLYNVEVTVVGNTLECVAIPGPGMRDADEDSKVLDRLLRRRVAMGGGDFFDLIAWKFPTDDPIQRWTIPGLSVAMLTPMSDHVADFRFPNTPAETIRRIDRKPA